MSHFDHCGSDMCPASSRVSCACSCARCMQSPIDDDRVCGMPASSCAAALKRLESRAAELEAALRSLVEAVSRANEYPCLPCSRRGHSHPEPIDSAPLRAALLLLAKGWTR